MKDIIGALKLVGWLLNLLTLIVSFSWEGAGGFTAPLKHKQHQQQHQYQQQQRQPPQQQAWVNNQMDVRMYHRLDHVSKMTLDCKLGQAGKAVTRLLT